MTTNERVLLAVAIVLVDIVLFALPLTGFFAAYVLLFRPPWFLAWLKQLYSDSS
jgi:hypothetical protein